MPRTTSTIARDLPDFPYSAATASARRQLFTLPSSSHFVTTIVSSLASSSADAAADAAAESTSPSDPGPDLPNPHQELADFIPSQTSPLVPSPSHSSTPSPAPAVGSSVPVETPLRRTSTRAESSKHPSFFINADRLQSSKNRSFKDPPPARDEANASGPAMPDRRRSSWRRVKRIANRIIAPFRLIKRCIMCGRGAMGFCEGFSSGASSPGLSWCSPGEYPPDSIRSVLENNALLGHLAAN